MYGIHAAAQVLLLQLQVVLPEYVRRKGGTLAAGCTKVILQCYKHFQGAVTVRFRQNKAGVQL